MRFFFGFSLWRLDYLFEEELDLPMSVRNRAFQVSRRTEHELITSRRGDGAPGTGPLRAANQARIASASPGALHARST